jgi:UDP-N-acetylmuramoyl-L-alanyl-D-glutamate--2,6-diaminopimelate ligase
MGHAEISGFACPYCVFSRKDGNNLKYCEEVVIVKLIELLKGLDYTVNRGSTDLAINKVEYDSRKIEAGDVFVCIEGFSVDGHKYAEAAVQKGATAVVCQKKVEVPENCTIITVEDSRKALALISANSYGKPAAQLKLIGITGTNGKTTSTYMMKSILEEAGYKVGIIGTIANYIGDRKIPADRTTPESLELHEMFKDMVEEGVQYCVMEVSSHSLSLSRVYGLKFAEGIFSNLTRDHLDFHKTFENYYEAKRLLFKNSETSIINLDDEYGRRIIEDTEGRKVTYAIESIGDVSASKVMMHSRGIDFEINYKGESISVNLKIPGKYNVYNALCSAAACLNEGIAPEIIKRGLEQVQVPGRCEIVTKDYNLGFEVIVDYAHTPDGLENILKTAREFTEKRLIAVFGCGGDRDRTKRPIMGRIGSDLSDLVLITSDNPRTEDPLSIINEIKTGINKENYILIENRREAIKKAIQIAEEGDVIVIAGKGHEDYQILKDKTIHFDEREIIKEIIEELF